MVSVTMKELLEAGVHFGHQVRRWNPKMKEYIFGERNGIYIVDLQKTLKLFKDAMRYVGEMAAQGKSVLFVGTKRQAQEAIAEEATRCNQYYVNQRWLGGLLTNITTVQRSIKRLKDLDAMATENAYEGRQKKEVIRLERERKHLQQNLAGIKDMNGLPDMLFVIDVRKEEIAVKEANRLGIPIVAVVDTNCSPEGINQVIPGNDDALRAIRLFASRIADSILEGRQIGLEGGVTQVESPAEGEGDGIAPDSSLPASARAFLEDEDAEDGPDVEVADETWETAEETHEEPAAGSDASQEPNTGAEAQEGQTEESSEASAS